MRPFVLTLLFVALPLGAAANEIATGVALVLGVVLGQRERLPLLGPVVAMAVVLLGASLGHGGASAVEALGLTWPLALCLAVPWLADGDEPLLRQVERVGLWVAGAVGAFAVYQAVQAGVNPVVQPSTGPFSHHLTLGYALIPPFAWALFRGHWIPLLAIGAGIGAAGSSGPGLAVAVVLGAWAFGPGAALVGGLAVALATIGLMAGDDELQQRAVLWTAGATLAAEHLGGVGPGNFRTAVGPVQESLQSGFHFANHAHDSALQVAARSGLAGWVAWAWLGVVLWKRASPAGRAGLAALAVGGLTQDTMGDLEVVRAATAWALLPAVVVGRRKRAEPEAVEDVEGQQEVES